MSKKLTKDERREVALKAALTLARKCGAKRVSLASVAAKLGVTAPLLFHVFENHAGFVKALTTYAKKQGVSLPVPAPTVRERRAAQPAKPKKVAALLKPKVSTPPVKVKAKKAAAPAPKAKKPLTLEQRKAKSERDRVRRAAAPTTPAGKFAALPKPFEAAIAQVAS